MSQSDTSAQNGSAYILKARAIVGDGYEQLRRVLENVNDYALFLLDRKGDIISWNKGATRETGYAEHEVLGNSYGILFTPEDRSTGIPEQELREARRTGRADDTRWLLCKDGTRFWAEGTLTVIRGENGGVDGFLKVSRNATERKQFEETLRDRDDRLTAALVAGRMGTWRWDIERDVDVLDESMAALLGLKRQTTELKINEFYSRVHDSDRAAVQEAFERSIREEAESQLDFRVIWPDASVHWLADHWRRCGTADGHAQYLTGACVDISERKRQEQELESSLKQKELLLKEVHHRVKNNLNVVSSLLSIQGDYAKDPETVRAFAEVQDRVRAIAGLHETLYTSEDLTNIHFRKYVDHLLGELRAVYDMGRNVNIAIDAADVVLRVDQAMPLGLILNELVCNAFKHAFPGQRPGNIDVVLRYASGGGGSPTACDLIVRDDGIGEGGNSQPAASIGTELVTLLVEQLQGSMEVRHRKGTEVAVRFPVVG